MLEHGGCQEVVCSAFALFCRRLKITNPKNGGLRGARRDATTGDRTVLWYGWTVLPTVLPSVFVSRVVSISHYLLKPRNGHSTHTNLSEHHPHHHHLTPTQDWKEHNPVRSGSPRNMDANIDTRKGSKTSEHPSVWRFTEREKRR